MSITDELRKWWVRKFPVIDKKLHKDFTAIADRIDAEHERQLEVLYRDMSDAEWVRLPKDADGVPIHIGDVVVEDGCGVPYKVMSLKLFDDCWDVGECGMNPNLCRHYHAPTVEDVLRGVVELCHNTWKEESAFHFYDVDDVMKSGNIAVFASKLRLAGDAE